MMRAFALAANHRQHSWRVAIALASLAAWASPAGAQVSDAERAAARELFREGDELQRAGKFAEALDKFNRAQQVFSAPTNMLRIAECDAALGRLVESAEAYRAVVRTPLPPASPPAFQSAVEQAKGELAQVEPRVPRLIVQVEPANAPGQQLQIDGQAVPAALIGEPFPLDPGQHKVSVNASGFASVDQSVILRERETKNLALALKPIAGVTYAPGSGVVPPPPLIDAPSGPATPGLPAGTPPPPPPVVEEGAVENAKKRSRVGLLLGLHVGLELPTGQIPASTPAPAAIDVGQVSSSGFAYAIDGGLRFARQWYLGLTLEHAGFGAGGNPEAIQAKASSPSSNTTAAGAVLGLIVNPDRVSFFGEIGVQGRWLTESWVDSSGAVTSVNYNGAELLLGTGIWIPVGKSVRLLPLATVGLGTFSPPNNGVTMPSNNNVSPPGHAFFMLGLGGYYNADL
jgi:hypothetical protein